MISRIALEESLCAFDRPNNYLAGCKGSVKLSPSLSPQVFFHGKMNFPEFVIIKIKHSLIWRMKLASELPFNTSNLNTVELKVSRHEVCLEY